VFAQVGFVMLIGLASKNAILIVEFANQLRRSGVPIREAAAQAAETRFRPILMTSIATILGAVPIAFASGAGAETRNPLGIAIVGGLSLSTAMTLYVVPIVYVLMDRLCVKLTGRSSAAGLKRAEEIKEQTERGAAARSGEPVPAS
jgi:multidrug efflux pump